ncbi:hypothetical protein RSPO_m00207 (plasmid) [Ralstonia solanacearum Po82]|uniref:Uncharacterized protein n=1 Tax=Ralstonia solanacearum (strain Po82) TaxID=1031711 RepID=F6G897_RALS8|nr:hypothetical protein RSPO_m00207 [Ralstonia solanacearum Po82]
MVSRLRTVRAAGVHREAGCRFGRAHGRVRLFRVAGWRKFAIPWPGSGGCQRIGVLAVRCLHEARDGGQFFFHGKRARLQAAGFDVAILWHRIGGGYSVRTFHTRPKALSLSTMLFLKGLPCHSIWPQGNAVPVSA